VTIDVEEIKSEREAADAVEPAAQRAELIALMRDFPKLATAVGLPLEVLSSYEYVEVKTLFGRKTERREISWRGWYIGSNIWVTDAGLYIQNVSWLASIFTLESAADELLRMQALYLNKAEITLYVRIPGKYRDNGNPEADYYDKTVVRSWEDAFEKILSGYTL
jgi:hypothetical protein